VKKERLERFQNVLTLQVISFSFESLSE